MKQIPFLFCFSIFMQISKAQISYTWNGSVSTAVTNPANWSPNGIPGPADTATIVTGSNTCILNVNATIAGLKITSGTLDLGGNTLTINGPTATFTSGTVQNGTITVTGATTTTFGNGTVNMNCIVNVTSAAVTFRNTIFQQAVNITKTGSSNDASNGNNIFNGPVTMTNTGSGYLMLGNSNSDQFNSTSTFNNTGSDKIYVAYNSSNNIFNGVATFNNSPTANTSIYVSNYSTGTLFNNDIIVNSSNGQGVQFCGGNTTASVTLAPGKTISPGVSGFSTGTLLLKQFTQSGTTPQNITLTGDATANFRTATFSGALSVNSPNIYTSSSIYNNATVLTKTNGTSSNATTGGNTFNGTLTVNYTSSAGNGYWSFGNGAADVYNGDVYSNNNSLDRIIFGQNSANNQFNGNFIVTQTGSSTGTAMTWNAGSTCVIAAGKTISIGGAGISSGYLALQGITQNGNTPINLTTTGASSITIGAFSANNPSVIGGSVTLISPDISISGGTFNAPVSITKTGGTNNSNNGFQNIFNSSLTINQQSNTGYFMLGYNSNDLFNDNITLTSIGTGGIRLGYASGTGTPTLASGKTILIGGAGFNAGYLQLNRFTQLGSVPMNLSLTGTNTSATFANNSVIGGNLVINSPDFYLNGCTFNGTVDATKTGATGDYSQGGNIFNGACNITNNGNGYMVLGSSNPDTWNNDVTFTNNGSERLLPCWSSAGNQFNGNIFVNTTGSANGIYFCGGNATATATLAAGKSIQAGVTGLKAGYLILRQFTQLGNAPVNLTLNSTATYLQFGPGSAFGGNVLSSSPGLYFNGCNFSGTVNSTKTGAMSDASSGSNVFNGASIFTNAGSGYLMFGNGNADQFNAASTFNNTGSANIYVANNSNNNIFGGVVTFNNTPTNNSGIYVSWNSLSTFFNDDISVTSTNGQGVQFCGANGSASATLSAGKTISVGAGGFTAGTLLLKQFTQVGSTPQSLSLTGSGNLTFGPSSAFGGNVTSSSPSLFFNGCSFSGTLNSIKTGTTNDQSRGNNTFNDASTFTNNGTGYLLMTINSPDTYNGDVTFVKNNTGLIYPNYNNNSSYAGNLTISASTPITFGANSGTTTFNGSGLQNINAVPGTPTPILTRVILNNTGSGVTLNNTSINVSNSLTLTSGLLNTSTSYILTMLNGSNTAAGTALSTSYVNGPMRYQKSTSGISTLNFPIGTSPDCRPVVLTVSHSNGALYTYQARLFNASAAALGYALPPTVDKVSGVHYYTIDRTDASGNNQPIAGLSGNQTIQIFFGNNDVVLDGGTLTIVKNTYTAPNSWIDIGGAGGPPYAFGSHLEGSITSTSSPSAFNSFSTFALADDMGGLNVLPIQVVNFNARVENSSTVELSWATKIETNSDYFTIEKSRDAVNFEFFQNVSTKALNGNSINPLNYIIHDANPYNGTTFYRLKQTDLAGVIKYWNIVSVNITQNQSISVYPNPTSGTIYISGFGNYENHLKIEWYDMSGRLLEYKNVSVLGGIAKIGVHLSNGVYLLRYTSSDGTIHQQNVIIRK
jgi:hypothetical protein